MIFGQKRPHMGAMETLEKKQQIGGEGAITDTGINNEICKLCECKDLYKNKNKI